MGIGFRERFRFLAGLSESALPLFNRSAPCAAERIGSCSCGLEKLFCRFVLGELLAAVRETFLAPMGEAAMELENRCAGGVEPVNCGALDPSFSAVPADPA